MACRGPGVMSPRRQIADPFLAARTLVAAIGGEPAKWLAWLDTQDGRALCDATARPTRTEHARALLEHALQIRSGAARYQSLPYGGANV